MQIALESAKRGNRRLVERICSSIPYVLGMVGGEKGCRKEEGFRAVEGYLVAWPVGEALRSGVLTDGERDLCVMALGRIRERVWAKLEVEE